MASLAGKADATIVSAAYKAAMANVPADYSKSFEKMADAYEKSINTITSAIDNFEAQRQAKEDELGAAMNVFTDPLAIQKVDADYEMMQNEVAAQREVWKNNRGFKNDPKGLQDWERANQQIIGRYQQDQSNLTGAATNWHADNVWKGGMSAENIEFATRMAKYGANTGLQSGKYNIQANSYIKNNPNATGEDLWNNLGVAEEGTVVKYRDPTTNEFTYISKIGDEIIQKKSSELKDMFPERADEALGSVFEMYNNIQQTATKTELTSDKFSNNWKNQLSTLVDTELAGNKNALKYLMHKKVGDQPYSFKEALDKGEMPLSTHILATLNELGLEGFKEDGDGVLDEDDFTDVNGYNVIKTAILNGDLDPKLSKDLYVEYTNQTFEDAHDLHRATSTTPKKKKPKVINEGGGPAGNYRLGQGGRLYNIATGKDTWVGWKYAGNRMQYDDEANLAKIKKHEEFEDPFGNIYKPNTKDIKIGAAWGGTDEKLYTVTDGATGEVIIGDDGNPIEVGIDEAIRNAYGKSGIDLTKL